MRKRGCDRMVRYGCGGQAVFVCRERALELWLKLVFSRALPGLFQQQQQLFFFAWQHPSPDSRNGIILHKMNFEITQGRYKLGFIGRLRILRRLYCFCKQYGCLPKDGQPIHGKERCLVEVTIEGVATSVEWQSSKWKPPSADIQHLSR